MFHCQQDSLARRLEALVVSCTPATRTRELQGKKAQVHTKVRPLVPSCELG